MSEEKINFNRQKLNDFLLSEIDHETAKLLTELISDNSFTDFRYVGNQYEIVKKCGSLNIQITDLISAEHGVCEEQCVFFIDADSLTQLIGERCKKINSNIKEK